MLLQSVKLVTQEHMLRVLGKAGANRWRGIRPTVRGTGNEPSRSPTRWW